MIVEKLNPKYNGKIINSIKTVSVTPINAKKALKIRTFFVYLFIPTQQDDSDIKHISLVLALFYALKIHIFHIIWLLSNFCYQNVINIVNNFQDNNRYFNSLNNMFLF